MTPKYVLVCTEPLGESPNINTSGPCPSGWLSVTVFELVAKPNNYHFPVCDYAFTSAGGARAGCPVTYRGISMTEGVIYNNDVDLSGIGIIIAATASVLSTAWIIRQFLRVLK